jgi:hypothetical protein
MTQALYAHMNNKTIKKKKCVICGGSYQTVLIGLILFLLKNNRSHKMNKLSRSDGMKLCLPDAKFKENSLHEGEVQVNLL